MQFVSTGAWSNATFGMQTFEPKQYLLYIGLNRRITIDESDPTQPRLE